MWKTPIGKESGLEVVRESGHSWLCCLVQWLYTPVAFGTHCMSLGIGWTVEQGSFLNRYRCSCVNRDQAASLSRCGAWPPKYIAVGQVQIWTIPGNRQWSLTGRHTVSTRDLVVLREGWGSSVWLWAVTLIYCHCDLLETLQRTGTVKPPRAQVKWSSSKSSSSGGNCLLWKSKQMPACKTSR